MNHYDEVYEAPKAINKYEKRVKNTVIDVYDVLVAFNVTCPAMQHAIKKCLMSGQRGHKDVTQDKREAIQSIERSIELGEYDE
jgi:coenzyme F420-reducing hydrogenase alpha subunit